MDLVTDVSTGSEFALKRIPCLDEAALKKAVREMELYRLFDHDHIIVCCDYVTQVLAGQTGGREVLALFPV